MYKFYPPSDFALLVKNTPSLSALMRHLGLNTKHGSHYRQIKKAITDNNLDISHYKKRKYNVSNLEPIVKKSHCMIDVMKALNLRYGGNSQAFISKKIKEFNIDISHFKKRPHNKKRRKWEDILVGENSNRTRTSPCYLRRALIESGVEYKCQGKGCIIHNEWLDNKIKLEVHHKDGNWLNNNKDNLSLLCPNCHSQTKNYCSGNVVRNTNGSPDPK